MQHAVAQATGGAGDSAADLEGRIRQGVDIDDLLNAFTVASAVVSGNLLSSRKDLHRADLECTVEDCSLEKKVVVVRRPSPCGDCGGGGVGKHSCLRVREQAERGRRRSLPVRRLFRRISFQIECGTCEGTGRTMSEERLKVGIPVGVQSVRPSASGEGGAGQNGARLAIFCSPSISNTLYTVDGVHLSSVPHHWRGDARQEDQGPDPRRRHRVASRGCDSGTTMRIKGRGLPKSKDGRGDLRLVLQPTPPPTDDEDALAHAEALEAHYTGPLRSWD